MTGQHRDLAVTGTPAPDLRLVIVFRADSPARLANLATVLGFLPRLLPGAEVLLLEDAAQPAPLPAPLPESALAGVRRVWRRNDGGFHRTRLLNHALLDPGAPPLVAAWDCDVLACPAGLAGALTALRAGAGMALPYDGRFIDLRGAVRQALVAAPRTAALPGPPYPLRRPWLPFARAGLYCENVAALGGAVMFRRDALAAAGGYHEGFRSWGYEDLELVQRMTRLGHPPQRAADWPLFHLSHPRAGRSDGWYAARRQNRALQVAMAALSEAALSERIASGALRVPHEGPALPDLARANLTPPDPTRGCHV